MVGVLVMYGVSAIGTDICAFVRIVVLLRNTAGEEQGTAESIPMLSIPTMDAQPGTDATKLIAHG